MKHAQKVLALEKEGAALQGDVRDRESTISERDVRVSALKAEAQQLAKFKFVLEYKLEELRRQLEPRDATIQTLQAQIKVASLPAPVLDVIALPQQGNIVSALVQILLPAGERC